MPKKGFKYPPRSEASRLKMSRSARRVWKKPGYKKKMRELFLITNKNNRPPSRKGMGKPKEVKPNQCEVCGSIQEGMKNRICWDHDHKTGKFRGWICGRCNYVLGLVKDNSELLEDLSLYLRRSRNEIKIIYD